MPQFTMTLGFLGTLLGLAGLVFDFLSLGYAGGLLWFLGCFALMAVGFCSAMRFTPMPDLMLRNAAIPVRARPRLTVIQGGKATRR